MQRTNSGPALAGAGAVVATLVLISAVCGAFVLTGVPIPEWCVIAGRWLPGVVTLAVIRLARLPQSSAQWCRVRTGGTRRFLTGTATAIGLVLAAHLVAALGLHARGIAPLRDTGTLLTALALLIPLALVFVVSTLGEEILWRGFLPQAWRHLGFWPCTAIVSTCWVLFHVPLHGAMAAQGTLSPPLALALTLGLFPLGLFLGAVSERFDSVWPAVFAHAVPFSAANLVQVPDADITVPVLGTVGSGILLLAAAIAVAPHSSRPTSPGRTPRLAG